MAEICTVLNMSLSFLDGAIADMAGRPAVVVIMNICSSRELRMALLLGQNKVTLKALLSSSTAESVPVRSLCFWHVVRPLRAMLAQPRSSHLRVASTVPDIIETKMALSMDQRIAEP